ncbi:hypothetical protein QVD17_16328 [Tagetes erecta]|uniref:Uncharacterized protein n=1 Tax=Tagetes erecta TaxID=13708 RepID=A0AAD8P0E4_TARER|nr:hypothetical protein QVD17_16328 [Tagetes erecta]
METSSSTFISPSFNTHPANDIADIADRVVHELRTQNGFVNDDVFSFRDDDIPPDTATDEEVTTNNHNHRQIVKQNEEINADEHDFEFPVSSNQIVSDDHISLQYPVFDKSLLSEIDFSFGNGVNLMETVTECKAVPSTRPSLRKLLSEDRDSISPSTSSSELDDLNGIAPATYCVWKPKPEQQQQQRGKHKKSNSISIGNSSKRWKVRDLLKRSYSDDSYSSGKDDSPVVVFVNDEKVNKNIKASTKAEKNIPAYKSKGGNLRLPPYLPYRQDQVTAVGHFNGSSTNLYRY